LLRESVTETLTEMPEQIEATLLTAEDPLMTFLEWSIEADPHGVWAAIVAASRVGIVPEITARASVFDQWWCDRLANLLEGRCAEDVDPQGLQTRLAWWSRGWSSPWRRPARTRLDASDFSGFSWSRFSRRT